jgi:hypothetical protein
LAKTYTIMKKNRLMSKRINKFFYILRLSLPTSRKKKLPVKVQCLSVGNSLKRLNSRRQPERKTNVMPTLSMDQEKGTYKNSLKRLNSYKLAKKESNVMPILSADQEKGTYKNLDFLRLTHENETDIKSHEFFLHQHEKLNKLKQISMDQYESTKKCQNNISIKNNMRRLSVDQISILNKQLNPRLSVDHNITCNVTMNNGASKDTIFRRLSVDQTIMSYTKHQNIRRLSVDYQSGSIYKHLKSRRLSKDQFSKLVDSRRQSVEKFNVSVMSINTRRQSVEKFSVSYTSIDTCTLSEGRIYLL